MLPRRGSPPSLIPVLVTGIQPRRVCAVNDCRRRNRSLAPKDLGALDPCDEHRDEGGEGVA
ncbi:integrase [Rhizobium sp. M10]|nr:integrase [Rhizobium sp. M10]